MSLGENQERILLYVFEKNSSHLSKIARDLEIDLANARRSLSGLRREGYVCSFIGPYHVPQAKPIQLTELGYAKARHIIPRRA